MSLLGNICDIKQEFNDFEVKEEFIDDSNEFNPATHKVAGSSLLSTFMEPKWNSYLKVEDERTSSLKYSLIADLDIKEEYEDQDIKIEISDDPNKYSETTEYEETSIPLSESNINSPIENNNRPKKSQTIINNEITAEKMQRRNPKRNCTRRSYVEDANYLESDFLDNDEEPRDANHDTNSRKNDDTYTIQKEIRDQKWKKGSTLRNSSRIKPQTKVSNQLKGNSKESCSMTVILDKFRGGYVGNREKHYDCPQCCKKFRDTDSVKRHLRVHTGEKPYDCPQCNKKFTESSHLKTHLRIHNKEKPYDCSQCKKKFGESSTLKRHIKIHTGEKPFNCHQCNKQFTRLAHMKRHLEVHNGGKPYECFKCNKKFTRPSTLKEHMKVHSEENEIN